MAVTWTATASPAAAEVDFASSSATFSSVSIGTASADRIVIVMVATDNTTGRTIDSVTIGGSAATVVKLESNTTRNVGIYRLLVDTGTTADIVVTVTGASGLNTCLIHVGHLTGADPTPTATPSQPWDNFAADPHVFAANPTIPTDGIGLCCLRDNNNKTPSWTNATEVYSTDNDTAGNILGLYSAKHATAGTWAMSVSGFAFVGTIIAGGVWGPSGAPTPGSIVFTITL